MNQRRQLYILAFAAYTTSLVVVAALAWLAIQYNTVAGIVQLTVALSGNGLGGFALVLGILRDDRADRERERAEKAEEEVKQLTQQASEAQRQAKQFQTQAEQFQTQAEQFQTQAEQERLRAERAEAELQRLRTEYEREIVARVSRIEAVLGLASTPDTENDDATER